ncbi:MAG TPA: ferritin [Phycisphaerae bacterium]|nr:ferritin [Phycisphaerae bacterium]
MAVSAKMLKGLNEQISNELNASHRYMAMSYSFDGRGLKVLSKFFANQSEEERQHALKIAQYVTDVDGTVVFGSLDQPKADYKSAKEIVQDALKGEEEVTAQIHALMGQAEKESDYSTRRMLDWFVEEQVEEVATMRELLQLVKMAGESNLIALENRLADKMAAAKPEED